MLREEVLENWTSLKEKFLEFRRVQKPRRELEKQLAEDRSDQEVWPKSYDNTLLKKRGKKIAELEVEIIEEEREIRILKQKLMWVIELVKERRFEDLESWIKQGGKI